MQSVWALSKHGYNGIYNNWCRSHCHRYVNEFSFRLNEGDCEVDTQDSPDFLFHSKVGRTITYDALTT